MKSIKIPSDKPASERELLARAEQIAGLTLADLAALANIQVPLNFSKHKGWSGQLIELCLGATAGSRAEQDFAHLGIELKSLPISTELRPLETTYVCYAPLMHNQGATWHTSNVRNKLQKVLWIPVQGDRQLSPGERMIGSPILWAPNEQEDRALQQDWEELIDMISLGQVERISARVGEVLQLRPKAANGSVLTDAIGEDGQIIQTRPRGFYLRKSFTEAILHQVR